MISAKRIVLSAKVGKPGPQNLLNAGVLFIEHFYNSKSREIANTVVARWCNGWWGKEVALTINKQLRNGCVDGIVCTWLWTSASGVCFTLSTSCFHWNSWARGPWDLCYCLQMLRWIYGSLKLYGLTKNLHYILAYWIFIFMIYIW